MSNALFRFYAELNDYLPLEKRQVEFNQEFEPGATVKHAIEALGVAHPEVDLILANGNSVDFSYRLMDRDHISVYPVFEALDISSIIHLRPQPLRDPRFVLDGHLGRLAAYLRMLGFDTLYSNRVDDEELAEISSRESRILLTRDRGLLKRKLVTRGSLVRDDNPRRQLFEIVARFDLYRLIRPFQRCLRCNGILKPVQKEEIANLLQPGTLRYYQEFYLCEDCGQVYWKGTHYQHMRQLVVEIQEAGYKQSQ